MTYLAYEGVVEIPLFLPPNLTSQPEVRPKANSSVEVGFSLFFNGDSGTAWETHHSAKKLLTHVSPPTVPL